MAPKLQIIFEGVDNVTGAVKDVSKSFSGMEGAADNLHKKLNPLTDLIGGALKVGLAGLAVGVGALGGVIASSVMDAAKFEQGLADITANMGATATETASLKSLIMDLGFDPQLKVNATEAAEAIGTLGTAGLSVDEIMGGAARSTVLLANATGADFADAAAIATDVMAQFNIEAPDLEKAVNGITSATIASKFSIDDYALALAQAGATAAATGVSFEDFNTTTALIAPNFASGSDAGTSLKTFFQRMIPTTADARAEMAKLGLTTADYGTASTKLASVLGHEVTPNATAVLAAFTDMITKGGTLEMSTEKINEKFNEFMDSNQINQFYDANGAMKDMNEIAIVLNGALGGLTEQQLNETMATLFGTDASRAALGVMSGGVVIYQTAAEAAAALGVTIESLGNIAEGGITQFELLQFQMSKTDAANSAATRMDTLSGAMEILWGVIDTLKLQIGDAFLPMVRQMTELFTEQAQKHGPALVEMFRGLATQLASATEKIIPWVEKNLPLMIAQIPDLVMSIGNFIAEVIDVGKELWIAIEPVVEFIRQTIGLKGVLIAVGAVMAISAVASIVSFVAGIVGAVGAVLGFVGSIGGLGAALGALLIPFWPIIAIIAVVAAAVYGLYLAWQNNLGGIQEKTRAVMEFVKGIFTDFPGTIESIKETFSAWGASAMTKLKEGFEGAKQLARDGLNTAMAWLAAGRDAALPPFQQALYEGGRGALSQLGAGFGAVSSVVKNQLGQIMGDVKEHGYTFATGALAGRFYEGARAGLLRFGAGLTASAPNLKTDMTNALNSVTSVIGEFANHAYNGAAAIVGGIRDGLNSIGLGGVATGVFNEVVNAFNWIMGTGGGLLDHVWGVMSTIGRNVVEALAGAIINSMQGLRDALNAITTLMPQWVKDKLGIASPSKVFADIGQNMMAGLSSGIERMALAPMAALSESMAGMMAVPSQMGGSAPSAGSGTSTSYTQQRTNNFNLNLGGSNAQGEPVQQVRSLIGQLSATYG